MTWIHPISTTSFIRHHLAHCVEVCALTTCYVCHVDRQNALFLHEMLHSNHVEINAGFTVYNAGSMVPFDMRMLHAELPQHVGRLHDSVDRLSHLRTVIAQVSSYILHQIFVL